MECKCGQRRKRQAEANINILFNLYLRRKTPSFKIQSCCTCNTFVSKADKPKKRSRVGKGSGLRRRNTFSEKENYENHADEQDDYDYNDKVVEKGDRTSWRMRHRMG